MKKILLQQKKIDITLSFSAMVAITYLATTNPHRYILLISLVISSLLLFNQFYLQRKINEINNCEVQVLGDGTIKKRTFSSYDGFRTIEVSLNGEKLTVLVTKRLFFQASLGDKIKISKICGRIYGE